MAKRLAIFSAITILITVIALLLFAVLNKINEKKEISARLLMLPELNLIGIDGFKYIVPKDTKIVLIYFDSNCNHCQYEAEEIRNNISRFKSSTIVFISSEELLLIQAFSIKHQLNAPNIHFARIASEDVYDTFGNMSIPEILIYGQDKKLIKIFHGETKIDLILKFVNDSP
ncbi:hypothetical protein BH09BAC3_BH09BAC3_08750 [soil metagenome]